MEKKDLGKTRNLTLNHPNPPVPLKTRMEAKFYSQSCTYISRQRLSPYIRI